MILRDKIHSILHTIKLVKNQLTYKTLLEMKKEDYTALNVYLGKVEKELIEVKYSAKVALTEANSRSQKEDPIVEAPKKKTTRRRKTKTTK